MKKLNPDTERIHNNKGNTRKRLSTRRAEKRKEKPAQ